MDLGLNGKRIVVTGGSKGIGYAIAQEFLKEGAHVVISGRNKRNLDSAVESLSVSDGGGSIQGFALDGSRESEMQELGRLAAETTGAIDVWINNIGTNKARAGELYTEAELDYLISACFKSTVFGSQAAFTYMKEKGGSIVNIASLAARSATCGRSTIYGALKSAIVGLTNTTAGEYAAYGIRVNAVLPGYTRTPLVAGSFSEEALNKLLENNLLGRMANPEEIAKPVVFLASNAASYITAAHLEVSGGHNTVLNPQYSFEKRRAEENSGIVMLN